MNGYLFKEGDIPAIVQSIENIMTNDEEYSKMSIKSLELVQQHDIDKSLRLFENLYQDQTGKL